MGRRCADETPLDEWLPDFLDALLGRYWDQLATSFNTIRHTGARVADIADRRPMTGPGTLVGYALRETTGLAHATVLLQDGSMDSTGRAIVPITLAPGESTRDWFGPGGISIANGLNVTIVGAVDGSLFLGGVE